MPDLEELLSKFDPERQERLRQLIARRKQFTPHQLNPEAEYGARPTDDSVFWGQVNQATLPARQVSPNIAWQSHVQPQQPPDLWEMFRPDFSKLGKLPAIAMQQEQPAFYQDPAFQNLQASLPQSVKDIGQKITESPVGKFTEALTQLPIWPTAPGVGLLGMAKKIPKGEFPKPSGNPYMKMPIERVRQDAEKGVNLAKEALAVREGKAIPKPPSPTVKPVAENVPPVEPQRIPLWQKAGIGKEPPPPPEPPTPTPSGGFPSGRQPGTGKQTPYAPPSQYDLAVETATPTQKPFAQRARDLGDRILFEMESTLSPYRTLERKTGIPVYKFAKKVPGAWAEGEDFVMRNVRPVWSALGDDVKELAVYLQLQRDMDIMGKYPAGVKLPGGVISPTRGIAELETKVGPERFAKIKKAAEDLWALNKADLKETLERSGILSEDARLALEAADPHYVPFYRQGFEAKDFAGRVSQNIGSVSTTGIRTMLETGSSRKLEDVIANFELAFIRRRVLVAENQTALATHLGLQELAESSGSAMPKVFGKGEKIIDDDIFGHISYFRNGEKVDVQVPKLIADSAKQLDPNTASLFYKAANKVTAPFRGGVTTYSLPFVLINIIRDATTSFYRGKLIVMSKVYRDGFKAAAKQNPDFERLTKTGGFMSGIISTGGGASQTGRSVGEIAVHNVNDALLLLPRLVRRVNEIGEQGTRAAMGLKAERTPARLYTTTSGKNVDDILKKFALPSTKQLDVMMAMRDTTVDFAEVGRSMRAINAVLPFTNVATHGIINVGKTMVQHPKWTAAVAAGFSGAAVALFAHNSKFETAKDIDQRKYRNNWIIVVGEGTRASGEKFPIYVEIPKTEVGAILSMPGETLARYLWDSKNTSVTDNLKESVATMWGAAMPIQASPQQLLPPGLSTAVDIQSNYDPYRGRPIIPRGEQERLPAQQFGAETSKMSVAIGHALGISPRQVEYAIFDYLGGVGQAGTYAVSKGLEVAGYQPQPYGAALKESEIGTSTVEQATRIPLVGRLLGAGGRGRENKDWENFKAVAEATKKTFYALPDMNRLGIPFGEVGDSITGAILSTKERTTYQILTGALAERGLKTLTSSPRYKTLPDDAKKEAIQASLNNARAKARDIVATQLSPASFTRYKIVQNGGSIKQFEETLKMKWDDPKAEAIIRTADKYLTPYYRIESDVWNQTGTVPGTNVQYKVLSDAWEKLAKKDAKKAKELMFSSPYGPAILNARKEILLKKRDMRLNTPMLESMLKLFY